MPNQAKSVRLLSIKQLALTGFDGTDLVFKVGEDDLYVDGVSASLEDVLERVMENEEFWIEARGTSVFHCEPVKEDPHEYRDSYEEEPETEPIDEVADVFYWVADVGQVIVFR